MTAPKSTISNADIHQTNYSLPEVLNLLSVCYKAAEDFCTAIRPVIVEFCDRIKLIACSPPVQHISSVLRLNTLIHPVLIEILPNGFTENELMDNWFKVQEALLVRYVRRQ